MLRRIFYLVPNPRQVEQLRQDLNAAAIAAPQIHAVTRDKTVVTGVADCHTMDETDRDELLEQRLWRINLLVFFLALGVAIGMALWSPSVWIWLPLCIMAGSFGMGAYFTLRIPNLHWRELLPALKHGEVVLMVDVPATQLIYVEKLVHRRYPEVVTAGVSWAR